MPTDVKKQGLPQMSANRPNIRSTGIWHQICTKILNTIDERNVHNSAVVPLNRALLSNIHFLSREEQIAHLVSSFPPENDVCMDWHNLCAAHAMCQFANDPSSFAHPLPFWGGRTQ